MNWNRFTPGLLAVGLCLGSATVSLADDDDHDHGIPTNRPGIHIRLYSPQGRPIDKDQRNYRFVVPSSPRFGAYYQFDKDYYYTPPVQRFRGRPEVAPRPITMTFGAGKHLIELSERLESLTNELCLDLHYNYRQNRNFNEIYGEAYQLLEAAKFVHVNAHQGDRKDIRRSATKIDNLFHHVQEEVSRLRRNEQRRVGQLSLEGKTEELQAVLHHLLYDLGVKPDHDKHDDDDHDRGPGRPGRQEAPPPVGRPGPPRR